MGLKSEAWSIWTPIISLTAKNREKMGENGCPRSSQSLSKVLQSHSLPTVSTILTESGHRKWVSTVSQSPHSLHSLYTTHNANFALLEAHCAKSARPNPPFPWKSWGNELACILPRLWPRAVHYGPQGNMPPGSPERRKREKKEICSEKYLVLLLRLLSLWGC